MKATITDLASDKDCAWCTKKTDCAEVSIEATFFKKNFLCWKCVRKAVELRHRQEANMQKEKSTDENAGS